MRKKRKETYIFCCFISRIKRCTVLHFNTTGPDPMLHATPHCSSPAITSEFSPGFPCPQTLTQTSTLPTSWTGVRGREDAPSNVRELFRAFQQEWVAIPARVIHKLIQSMPERCWAVTDSRGGHPPPSLPQHTHFCACYSVAKYRVSERFLGREEC